MNTDGLQVKMRAVGTIKPYPENAKKHPRKQLEQVAASIKEFGFNQPIVVDKEGVIIVGHGRYAAAKDILEMAEVPVYEVELTEEQAKAYRLADNKLNESPWDMKLVIPELKSLSEPMLELTGFAKGLVIESNPGDDALPEAEVPPISLVGDIYQLGEHRLMVGDSTSADAATELFGEHLADLVFTDPPYNVEYVGKTKDALTIENDHMSEGDFLSFLQSAFGIMAAFSKRGGVHLCVPRRLIRSPFQAGIQGRRFPTEAVLDLEQKQHGPRPAGLSLEARAYPLRLEGWGITYVVRNTIGNYRVGYRPPIKERAAPDYETSGARHTCPREFQQGRGYSIRPIPRFRIYPHRMSENGTTLFRFRAGPTLCGPYRSALLRVCREPRGN